MKVFIDQSPPERLSLPRRRLMGKGIRNVRWSQSPWQSHSTHSTAFISGVGVWFGFSQGAIFEAISMLGFFC